MVVSTLPCGRPRPIVSVPYMGKNARSNTYSKCVAEEELVKAQVRIEVLERDLRELRQLTRAGSGSKTLLENRCEVV